MGALANKQLKPVHKRTQGSEEAGTEIEDAQDFCKVFGQSQGDFETITAMIDQANDDEKA